MKVCMIKIRGTLEDFNDNLFAGGAWQKRVSGCNA
jgi:hypothetical protein